MNLRLLSIAALTIAITLLTTTPSQASRISRQNPYRSFSVHGHNYGAIRWEQTQRSKQFKPMATKILRRR